jgi:hypothetical protein
LIAIGKWPELYSPALRTSITKAPFLNRACASFDEIWPERFNRKKTANAATAMMTIVQFIEPLAKFH